MTVKELTYIEELYSLNLYYVVEERDGKYLGIRKFNHLKVELFQKVFGNYQPTIFTYAKNELDNIYWANKEVDYKQILDFIFNGVIKLK